ATSTMVHSKVTIIDNRLLRIGSANLNNRSMGADTECDLIFEATNEDHRAHIAEIRNRLLGEHCGTNAREIAASLRRTGSLLATAEKVSHNGHSLRPIDDGEPDPDELSAAIEEVADPARPLAAELVLDQKGSRLSRMQVSTLLKIVLAALLVIALPLTWQYTPLSTLANPDVVRASLSAVAESRWAPFAVVAIFVSAGLVAFPVLVLIAVTAATFGPFYGLLYAALGSLSSALVTYLIGARLGKDMLRAMLGPRLDRIRRHIVNQGVISVAAVRVVPVAPFTLVNLVAGASQIRLQDFLAGTVLGMAPGWIVMSALGHQIFQIITQPTATNVALLGAAIVAWIAVSVGIQILVSKYRRA
ncbi:MAG TPA: VTT domain-containing protein, partial [Xanthobacteraceae bacterium]